MQWLINGDNYINIINTENIKTDEKIIFNLSKNEL